MIGAIIQARLGSSRLPGKIIKKINKRQLIEIMISRLRKSKLINKIIICTTYNKEDEKILEICRKMNIDCIRGSTSNVLSRYLKAAKKFKIKTIVRLTSDCPLIDPKIIDKMLLQYNLSNFDFLSNTCPPNKSTFPDGTDVEIFDFKTFAKIAKIEKRKEFLEHVTYNYWKDNKYKSSVFLNNKNYSKYRYTLDYKEDLIVLKKIINYFDNKIDIVSTNQIVNYLKKNRDIYLINDKCKNLSSNWKKL